ncbi:hypothetical protein BSLG_003921 [Batrachochytrium salamandrivorans]|nr:hypothetical protein BSLG_003921 [Batrachochytrium salamandrivorans]
MSSTRVRHSSSMQYTPRSNTHIDSSTQSNSTYRHGTKRKRNAPGQSSVEDIASAGSLSLHGAMYETTAPSYAHLDFSAWTEASLRKYGKTFALDSVLFGDAAASSPPLKKRMAPADTPAYTMTVSNLRGRPSKGNDG